ncbi:MAG TPA: PAS domain-containing protein [Gammaproteobacteria bacterium]|nr:PAS domain-containing protein [Gammaproteobacteria bacterium]
MNNVSDYAAQDRLIEKLKEEVCYLDNILALMPGYVYWLDSNNVFLGCNNMLVELFNIDSREQIVGKNNFDFLDKPQAELLDAANNKVMENGEPYIFEETIKWPDSDKTYLTHKVPLKNMQGQIVGLLGVSFDISDRKKVEEELRLMALSNQAKTDFIRNMEHDIRTPLSGMLSVASHLASIETDPTKKELLMDLENASQELIGYLNTIIEVSRMDEGRVPAIMQEFNFEHMVKSMFMLELPAAKSKKIDFILAYDDAIPEKVVGDSFRAYRILLNLVSNAIKFTDQGFVKINIKLLEKNEHNIKV